MPNELNQGYGALTNRLREGRRIGETKPALGMEVYNVQSSEYARLDYVTYFDGIGISTHGVLNDPNILHVRILRILACQFHPLTVHDF